MEKSLPHSHHWSGKGHNGLTRGQPGKRFGALKGTRPWPSTHPGASGLSTACHFCLQASEEGGVILRGKGILTFPTLGVTETLSPGMLLPFLPLPRSLAPRMGTGCCACSRPPGGASEAGSLKGPHAPAGHKGPAFHHSDIFTHWYFQVVHFSLKKPPSLVKMLCYLSKGTDGSRLLKLFIVIQAQVSKSKVYSTIEEAGAWAS